MPVLQEKLIHTRAQHHRRIVYHVKLVPILMVLVRITVIGAHLELITQKLAAL